MGYVGNVENLAEVDTSVVPLDVPFSVGDGVIVMFVILVDVRWISVDVESKTS